MSSVSSNYFHGSNTLFFSLVSKHGSINTISNGIDTGNSSFKVFIDLNTSKLVGLNSKSLQSKSISIRTTSSSNQDDIILFFLSFSSFGSFRFQNDTIVLNNTLHHFGFELKVETLFLEGCLKLFGQFHIHGRTEAVHKFNDCDFSSKSRPYRTHFQSNHSTTDDSHCLWNTGNFQGTRRIDNFTLLIIHRHGRQWRYFGPRGNDDVFRLERFRTSSSLFIECHRDTIGSGQGSLSLEVLHLVFFE
mmetsp:Transcript_5377/g.9913  ORF Transcript_5377/g.9913 Transcript_5377/m.9913 type:complete len:246 (-) Transcript_5377:386-1123(-)